jgi:hypothetical protein
VQEDQGDAGKKILRLMQVFTNIIDEDDKNIKRDRYGSPAPVQFFLYKIDKLSFNFI